MTPNKSTKVTETSRLEIFERGSDTILYSTGKESDGSFEVNIEGHKYDNQLRYRFTSISPQGEVLRMGDPLPLYKGGIAKALTELDPSVGPGPNFSILDGISESEAEYLTRNILSTGYRNILLNPDLAKLKTYDDFLTNFPLRYLTDHWSVSYVHELLWMLISYVKRCIGRGAMLEVIEMDVIDRIAGNYARTFGLDPIGIKDAPGILVAKGHIRSLGNREEASKLYELARRNGGVNIESFLRVDALATYFSDAPYSNRPELVAPVESPAATSGPVNLCFSADREYFKMFAPYWAVTSTFYSEYIFNYLVITETKKEFDSISAKYEAQLIELGDFIGKPYSGNVKLHWMSNAQGYGRTLYACGRFMLAEHLLSKASGDVFICDIDQIVIGDLSKFLETIAKTKSSIKLPIVENYYALLPGRSHLAGYIYLHNSNDSSTFIAHVVNYILVGLGKSYSWMLDQNAIRYASEIVSVAHLDVRGNKAFGHFPSHKNSLKLRL